MLVIASPTAMRPDAGAFTEAHEGITRTKPAHRAVADGDEESLVRHRRMAQHAVSGVLQVHIVERELVPRARQTNHVAQHLRRLAEDHLQVHVHRRVPELRVLDLQPPERRRLPQHRKRAALALAQRPEQPERRRRDRKHIALLRLVAPDLARRHARIL
jgi:hypothetical protein